MVQSLFQGIFDRFKSLYFAPSIRIFKIRMAIGYLEGVKGAHKILILVCMLVFVITLIGAGLVLIPLALLVLMPWEPVTKAFVGMFIGVLYLVVPAFALLTLLSEKRWMRMTGATQLLRQLVD